MRQGDRQTHGGLGCSRTAIPLAHCVRPSPFNKGVPTTRHTIEHPPLGGGV